jgi:hypothetical protein
MHSLGIVSITGPAASEDRTWARRVAVGIILWALGVAALGIAGIFAALPLEAFPDFVAAGILVPVLLYGTHPGLR